uniref:Uncharacterized protein n=1 Tax=Candidatus Phytoplasma australasiaticum subsp. australasiaticum TaxID=2832407 RepID=A0A7S7JMF5_9MOLU|nr:hypothetical protein H7685_01380 ['Parthenium hysterophorus' phyllody phytoplasma]
MFELNNNKLIEDISQSKLDSNDIIKSDLDSDSLTQQSIKKIFQIVFLKILFL